MLISKRALTEISGRYEMPGSGFGKMVDFRKMWGLTIRKLNFCYTAVCWYSSPPPLLLGVVPGFGGGFGFVFFFDLWCGIFLVVWEFFLALVGGLGCFPVSFWLHLYVRCRGGTLLGKMALAVPVIVPINTLCV